MAHPSPHDVHRRCLQLEARLKSIVALLIERLAPRRILLFGSRARGTAHRGSDIDLAVEGARSLPHREERRLREAIDDLSGIYMVDLVFLERTESAFRERVYATAKVLYEQD